MSLITSTKKIIYFCLLVLSIFRSRDPLGIWSSGARENSPPFGRGSNPLCPPQNSVCVCSVNCYRQIKKKKILMAQQSVMSSSYNFGINHTFLKSANILGPSILTNAAYRTKRHNNSSTNDLSGVWP